MFQNIARLRIKLADHKPWRKIVIDIVRFQRKMYRHFPISTAPWINVNIGWVCVNASFFLVWNVSTNNQHVPLLIVN